MVDATDRRVIDALIGDGRASLRTVADHVGVSPTTVATRLDDLDGVVDRVVPILDYGALGEEIAVVRLRVDGSNREAVTDRLDARPRLLSVYAVTGPTDVIAVGAFDDRDAIDDARSEIHAIEGVREIEVDVVREVVTAFEQFPVAERA